MGLLPITLPDGFDTKVSVGDKVKAGEILAERNTNKDEIIHLADLLRINPQKIKKYLKKNLGDKVEIGDVIAVKKGNLGLGQKKVVSDIEGTLIKVDEDEGRLVIRTSTSETKTSQITSPVEGVIEICDNDKIVISSNRNAITARVTTGQDTEGEIIDLGEEVNILEVNLGVAGKIIIGERFERGSVFKALGLGAIGVIGLEIRESEIDDATDRKLKYPIVILDEEEYRKLSKRKGKILIDTKNNSIVLL